MWNWIFNKITWEEDQQEEKILLDRDSIMFNQVRGTNKDIVMINKHIIYKKDTDFQHSEWYGDASPGNWENYYAQKL